MTSATVAFDTHRREAYEAVDAHSFRDWASGVKSHALTHLAELLERAEARLTERGARVHWAETAADVHEILDRIVQRVDARSVVKGKSMVSEELGVNEFLAERGVDVVETDLGEYVIQLLGEPPSHIVGPAIHRSLEDIRALFRERFGVAADATPDDLAAVARRRLRQAFLEADIGLTGGNFLVAETGTVVLMENEGNIRLTTSLPRVHVALVGVEKVVARWDDVAGMVQLTARAATGQGVPIYVTAVDGPAERDDDGPEEVHVILVDNGRTRVLADPKMWEALRCVRCGACLNVCPVYRQTGGHAYGWVYSGPIGSVLAPAMQGEEGGELPFASSLCGACSEVCPVRIPLDALLLEWRRRAVEDGRVPATERWMARALGAATRHPALYRAGQRVLRSLPVLRVAPAPVSGWVEGRSAPVPSARSFRERWKEGIE